MTTMTPSDAEKTGTNMQNEAFEIIAKSLEKLDGVTRRNMFGWDCLFINGNSFLGGSDRGMLFKFDQEGLARAVRLPGVQIFDPMGNGKGMTGWAIAEPSSRNEWPRLSQMALNIAEQLPPKDKAKKKSAAKVAVVKKSAPAKKAVVKKASVKKAAPKKAAPVKKAPAKKSTPAKKASQNKPKK